MDAISWYALGRAVADPTTIDEEIDAKILTHNLDGSAHGQSNEAIFLHRAQSVLDHINYSIYNIKLQPICRPFKAICDLGGSGDFTTIQQAIDYVNLNGGGKVLVTEGTFNLGADLTLYSNIILQGSDKELTIVDFGDSWYHVKAIGTSGSHLRNIEIHDIQFKHETNNEDYTIEFTYVDDAEISRNKFEDCHDSAGNQNITIYATSCVRFLAEDNYFHQCDEPFVIDSCDFAKIQGNRFESIYACILYLMASTNCFFRENLGNNLNTSSITDGTVICNTSYSDLLIDANNLHNVNELGIWSEDGDRMTVSNNTIEGGASARGGVSVSGVTKSVFSGNRIINMGNTGIDLYFDCNDNTITGNVINGTGGYGVDIEDSSDNRNVIVGNALYGNPSGAIHDAGTGTVKDHNSS